MTQAQKYTAKVLHWGDLEDWEQDALPADENGYVTGYLVNTDVPLIIGEIVFAHDDLVQPEFWAKIDPKTITPVEPKIPVDFLPDAIVLHYDEQLGGMTGYLAGQAYFDKHVKPFLADSVEVIIGDKPADRHDADFERGLKERQRDYFGN